MEENTTPVTEVPQEQPVRILKADDVVSYLNTIKTALSNVTQYLSAIEADIAVNAEKINTEINTDAS
jgi:hypothetical protein